MREEKVIVEASGYKAGTLPAKNGKSYRFIHDINGRHLNQFH